MPLDQGSQLLIAGTTGIVFGLVVIIINTVSHFRERKEWKAERQDLLDRLMSKDFSEYAGGSRVLGPTRGPSNDPTDAEQWFKEIKEEAEDQDTDRLPVQ